MLCFSVGGQTHGKGSPFTRSYFAASKRALLRSFVLPCNFCGLPYSLPFLDAPLFSFLSCVPLAFFPPCLPSIFLSSVPPSFIVFFLVVEKLVISLLLHFLMSFFPSVSFLRSCPPSFLSCCAPSSYSSSSSFCQPSPKNTQKKLLRKQPSVAEQPVPEGQHCCV